MQETDTVTPSASTQPAQDATGAFGASNGSPFVQEKSKARTAGWALFDILVHGGIGYGLNIALAMLTAVDNWNYQKRSAIRVTKAQDLLGNMPNPSPMQQELLTMAEPRVFVPFVHKIAEGIKKNGFIGKIADDLAWAPGQNHQAFY